MNKKENINPFDFSDVEEVEVKKDLRLKENVTLTEQDEERVTFTLEHAEEMEMARKAFEEEGFSSGVYVTEEGEEDIAIYNATTVDTPLQVLMEITEADLPYLSEQTKTDYENYISEFQIETKRYDALERRRSLRERFK